LRETARIDKNYAAFLNSDTSLTTGTTPATMSEVGTPLAADFDMMPPPAKKLKINVKKETKKEAKTKVKQEIIVVD
jgi:hypothetical protein